MIQWVVETMQENINLKAKLCEAEARLLDERRNTCAAREQRDRLDQVLNKEMQRSLSLEKNILVLQKQVDNQSCSHMAATGIDNAKLKRDLEAAKKENERLHCVLVDKCVERISQANAALQVEPFAPRTPYIPTCTDKPSWISWGSWEKARRLTVENEGLRADIRILKADLEATKDKLKKAENGAVVLQDLLDAQRQQIDRLETDVLIASKNGNIREAAGRIFEFCRELAKTEPK